MIDAVKNSNAVKNIAPRKDARPVRVRLLRPKKRAGAPPRKRASKRSRRGYGTVARWAQKRHTTAERR